MKNKAYILCCCFGVVACVVVWNFLRAWSLCFDCEHEFLSKRLESKNTTKRQHVIIYAKERSGSTFTLELFKAHSVRKFSL